VNHVLHLDEPRNLNINRRQLTNKYCVDVEKYTFIRHH
jgi:hypothetical protein